MLLLFSLETQVVTQNYNLLNSVLRIPSEQCEFSNYFLHLYNLLEAIVCFMNVKCVATDYEL